VPPEVEWFANLSNPQTRRACENAIQDSIQHQGRRRNAAAMAAMPAKTYRA
jgi:hypothetical protein